MTWSDSDFTGFGDVDFGGKSREEIEVMIRQKMPFLSEEAVKGLVDDLMAKEEDVDGDQQG